MFGAKTDPAEVDVVLPMADQTANNARFSTTPSLEGVLAVSDIVVNPLPLTAETEGVPSSSAFERMRAGASLVILGRRPPCVNHGLLAALDTQHLSRAVLDVFTSRRCLPTVTQSPGRPSNGPAQSCGPTSWGWGCLCCFSRPGLLRSRTWTSNDPFGCRSVAQCRFTQMLAQLDC